MSEFKLYGVILNSLIDEETVQFLKNDDRSAARKISDDVEQFLKES